MRLSTDWLGGEPGARGEGAELKERCLYVAGYVTQAAFSNLTPFGFVYTVNASSIQIPV